MPQSVFIPIMLCCLVFCQFFSKCWPQPIPRTQVGMSFIYCCVCMSMRFMMCVQGMNVLQRCVEVRGQLSQVSSPVSLIEARSGCPRLVAQGTSSWISCFCLLGLQMHTAASGFFPLEFLWLNLNTRLTWQVLLPSDPSLRPLVHFRCNK